MSFLIRDIKKLLVLCMLGVVAVEVAAIDGTFTMYRNSPLDPSMRLHVATFDASDGEQYNRENCNVAADLFSRQVGVKARFWCEAGRFRK